MYFTKSYTYTLAILLTLLVAGSSVDVLGQSTIIKVFDENNEALEFASILLLNAEDSTLVLSGLTDETGVYNLDDTYWGDYLLQVHYLGYHSYEVNHSISSPSEIKITMMLSTEELETIEVITDQLAFRGLGDTVEYNTAHLVNRPGDVVEDLLKKLPGIEVKRDGTLKAYGEDVQNVLVDGKEFFGRDTRTATKNLDANAVDKVEVFDKGSEMAELTGVEDGRDEKTINLKLKEGYKNGYFGKAEGHANPKGQYDSRWNVNRFNPKTRLSILDLANNVNSDGFSFSDYMNFMGGIGAFARRSAGGGVSVELDGNNSVPVGGQSGDGIARSWATGLNLNHDFSDRSELSAHYFYNNADRDLRSFSTQSYFLSDGSLQSANNTIRNTVRIGHQLNYNWKYQIDTSVSLSWRGSLGVNNDDVFSRDISATESIGVLINNQSRINEREGDGYNVATSLLLKKKGKKRGKALILQGGIELRNMDQLSRLQSESQLVTTDIIESINQNQHRDQFTRHIESSLAYTLPLGKRKQYLQLDGIWSSDHRRSTADFFDIDSVQNSRLNLDLSNRYTMDFWYGSVGAKKVMSREKYNLTYGLYYQHSELKGLTSLSEKSINKSFNVFLPQIFFDYNFGAAHRLSTQYSTGLLEPSIEQLQPVVDNRDPLNIYKGNPELNAEYMHRWSANYLNYDAFSFSSLYGRTGFELIIDKITDVILIDSLARRIIQPFNISQEYTGRGSLEYGRPIKPLRISAKLRLGGRASNGLLFINDIENRITRLGYTIDFSIENRKKKKMDLLLGYRYKYNETLYSEDLVEDQYYKENTLYSELRWSSKTGFGFNSEFEWTNFSDPFTPEVTEQFIWNLELSKTLGTKEQFLFKISVNDVFNSNKGVRRFSNLDYYQFQQSNVLGRYAMLGLAYNLRGFKKDDSVTKLKFGS